MYVLRNLFAHLVNRVCCANGFSYRILLFLFLFCILEICMQGTMENAPTRKLEIYSCMMLDLSKNISTSDFIV